MATTRDMENGAPETGERVTGRIHRLTQFFGFVECDDDHSQVIFFFTDDTHSKDFRDRLPVTRHPVRKGDRVSFIRTVSYDRKKGKLAVTASSMFFGAGRTHDAPPHGHAGGPDGRSMGERGGHAGGGRGHDAPAHGHGGGQDGRAVGERGGHAGEGRGGGPPRHGGGAPLPPPAFPPPPWREDRGGSGSHRDARPPHAQPRAEGGGGSAGSPRASEGGGGSAGASRDASDHRPARASDGGGGSAGASREASDHRPSSSKKRKHEGGGRDAALKSPAKVGGGSGAASSPKKQSEAARKQCAAAAALGVRGIPARGGVSDVAAFRMFPLLWESKVMVGGRKEGIAVSAHLVYSRGDDAARRVQAAVSAAPSSLPPDAVRQNEPLHMFARINLHDPAVAKLLQPPVHPDAPPDAAWMLNSAPTDGGVHPALVCVLLPNPISARGGVEWLSNYLRNKGRAGFGSISEWQKICALILPSEMPMHNEMLPGCSFPALLLWEGSSARTTSSRQ